MLEYLKCVPLLPLTGLLLHNLLPTEDSHVH